MSLPSLECVFITDEFILELKNGEPKRIPNPVSSPRFLYELCWSMVFRELPFQKCKTALDAVEFSDKPSNVELGSYLADIVAQMAQDITMSGESRSRLLKLARWLVESTMVPLRHFWERCEEEFLAEAEMVKIRAQDLKSKEVRVNTRLLYQQTKFNLLREESEGYAKLATLLSQCTDVLPPKSSASTVGVIKSIIGQFDLDPNRVFDIVLECFELQPNNNLFLDLIPIFPKSHASQILGFKFQYYQRMEVQSSVPFSLYQLAALLVKEDFIDLDSIYVHLLPKDEEAFNQYSAFSAMRLEEANKIGKINLAATGKDLMEDEKQGDVTIDLYTAVDQETDAVAGCSSEFENNQTLGLLTGFLSVDDWNHAHILFDRLSPLYPVAHVQICNHLFRLIEKTISSAYQIVRPTHLQKPGPFSSMNIDMEDRVSLVYKSLVLLPKELFQMLACVGPYLYRNTLLLQKVCSVLKAFYLSALEVSGNGTGAFKHDSGRCENYNPHLHLKEVRPKVEGALGSCLLPALQLVPANPAVGHAIWEVMSLLPYETRYRLYGEWEKDDERIPMILAARQTAKLDTRRILKRLAKENLKQLGRMVAKLAHANPMTVLRTIIHQIEAYRDMITPVVDAFKYLTQLEYDVLEYVVIERLAQGGRDKLKDDGLNLSDWLQSLASFWGHLCKKYPSMELRGLFQYLVNQLKRGTGIELILLQELIQQMANVQYTENMTEDQLDAMAGGDTLRYQATSFGVTRNKALIKSTIRLRDALLPKEEPQLAIPLLLLIAQHRSLIVINATAPYIKMVSEQYDRCHGILLQYVEFLNSTLSPATAYAQLIPSLDDLVHLYHLEPEVAFLVYRPVMRLFKCQNASGSFWPLCDKEAGNLSNLEKDSESGSHGDLVLDLVGSPKPIRWTSLVDTVRTMLPSKAWNSLSPDLYVTFWGLNLYDLYVPRHRYESEITKQHAALKALEELADNSSSAIAKRKKDKERIQESLDRITGELQRHQEHVASVRKRLSLEKDRWLSDCPETLKINMEFLQRCIFPRCTFSTPDAVYCALFVQTLHSLGTPYFNTVNHIDVLICKTLHPMICCCTEYEVGRLGRFLYETLKLAYYWKSDESIYEQECGNKPGFAVYYRYPNSQRVTYAQFIKVHWKWSGRITRLLIQCLESTEYMEIRNALIMLTKISSVFPVTRKSGINIEKRVAKIKGDEREDLKVLATSVAAALAARKPSWVTEEEFGMGYLEIKPLASKAMLGNGSGGAVSQNDPVAGRAATGNQHLDNANKDQSLRSKAVDGRENFSGNLKSKGGSDVQASSSAASFSGMSRANENLKLMDEPISRVEDGIVKSEGASKPASKRGAVGGSLAKSSRLDETKSSKAGNVVEGRQTVGMNISSTAATNGTARSSEVKLSARDDASELPELPKSLPSRAVHSPRHDSAKATDKQPKRSSPADEPDRISKRRKGESETDFDSRIPDRDRALEKSHNVDFDKSGVDEPSIVRGADRHLDRVKDKSSSDKYDRDHRDRSDRADKPRSDDGLLDKSRDRSMERYGRERSVDRGIDKIADRVGEKAKDERTKDDRGKSRHSELHGDKSQGEDRLHSQNLPPPPPLPPHVVPQSLSGRRDEEADRRFIATRHSQRLSPRHEDKERRRSEESLVTSHEDSKRRREDDFRDRKREEREVVPNKVEDRERERERDRTSLVKEDVETNAAAVAAASKRRKLKRDHLAGIEPGEYSPSTLGPPLPPSMGLSHDYDGRDRVERKGTLVQRPAAYFEEPGPRVHGKEAPGKIARRDSDPMYDRDWDDEKRQRVEPKRRHRK